jgi:hypothetical protein
MAGSAALLLLVSWVLSIFALSLWAWVMLLGGVAVTIAGIWYIVSHLRYATGLEGGLIPPVPIFLVFESGTGQTLFNSCDRMSRMPDAYFAAWRPRNWRPQLIPPAGAVQF